MNTQKSIKFSVVIPATSTTVNGQGWEDWRRGVNCSWPSAPLYPRSDLSTRSFTSCWKLVWNKVPGHTPDVLSQSLAWFHARCVYILSFPGGASGKEPTCQSRRQKRHGFNPWVGKISWRRAWKPTSVFFPGKSHGQRSLAGYSP